MTVIDIRTFFTGYVLSILLCVIVMTSLWWQNRKRSPEIILWLTDYVLQFIGLLLITFRGILPDLFTIVFANLFIIGGTVFLYIGLGRYVGKESRQLHNYVMLAVFTFVHVFLTYVYPNIELRLVNLSLALIYICAQCSWLMLRRVDRSLRPATRATGIVFAVFCLVSMVQIVVNLTIPKVNNIFVSGSFGVVAVLMYQILFIALTFALFLLVSRRLSTALESELYQRTQAEWALKERFKELNCLYGISSIIEIPGISVDEILKKAVMLLPPAMQFPEITEARMTLERETFQTKNFRETPWMLINKIIVNGTPVGQVEVCYLEERPASDEGPFLIEERQLLIAIAERLAHVVERNMAEEQIHRNETRLMSLLNIIQHRTKTTQEFLDYALDEVIKLTDSKIGYIYFYHEDRRQFVLNTWSNDVMKECTIANPQTCYELEKTGIWGEAVRQRKPIILNDFKASHPLKKGYPEGHAHLTNFMTVPIFNEDQIIAVVGIANKARDYDETDVLQLTLFMDAVWKSVDIKMGEEKLRESEEKIHLLLNSIAEAIYGIDMNGNCTFCNAPCLHLLGYKHPEELLGKNMHWLIHSKRPDGTPFPVEECRIFQAFKKGEGAHVDDEVLWRSDGTSFPAEYWSYPQRQGDVVIGAVVTFLDITERKQAEEQIKHMATHDLLTDLPSLRLARDRFSVALNMARRYKKAVAVMFIDLDGFKAVNDTFGHDAGDYVLKQVAQRLLSCVRETDTVARVGGDEFLIIATEINTPENAAQIAEKVIQLASQPVIFNGQQAAVGTSIGIALFPDHGKDMDQLVKLADEAMYKVKNTGKNGFRFVNTAIK
jgi:diguanylate cyclase (GGDEF)-like protein/PAS domain S-box-containing protein